MKKVLIFGFIIFVLLSFKVVAHSPSSMNINYDIETKEMTVSITHTVSNPANHYIYNITIERNNEFYRSYEYTNQPTNSYFSYNYSGIEGEVGDMFSVVASCIQGGQISKSLTVGSDTGESATPGFEIIFVICAIALILFWKAKKR